MKYEYKDGPNARDNFEDAMKTLFKAPKTVSVGAKVKRPKKGASVRKTDVSDKGELNMATLQIRKIIGNLPAKNQLSA